MAKEILEQANELFIDDRYDEAYEFYSKALTEDDRSDRQFTSKIFASRAQCSLKMKKYSDALRDSVDAIQLDQSNIKGYLRQGISLYHQDQKEEALKAFQQGSQIDENNDQFKVWIEKCQKDLEEKKPKSAPVEPPKATPTVPVKIKHSFYQTDSVVTIQVPIKGLKKDQIQLETTDTNLKLSTKIPSSGNDYSLEFDLAHPIDSSRTSFTVTGSNIEIKLFKRQSIQWTTLDHQGASNKNQPAVVMSRVEDCKSLSYPSSSQRAKNWDKIEAEIKKDDKDEMSDANAIFQKLYRESDENTRRAMNKSMYESGGTCLNMNWEEVSKGKVSTEPPDGMEWKKYDS